MLFTDVSGCLLITHILDEQMESGAADFGTAI